ncbi:hypothetical protein [Nocardiopsis alkaliphila]|uniref:hypothetical protein n=1 Tax=Nocardiopsis alkaliphila TaxID=225762 RepID=UPI00034B9125|nr:hypothetical protein [Nocardiopsis alkaliphila]
MSTTSIVEGTATGHHPARADQRGAYGWFAVAFVFGHGGFAVSQGDDPLLELPLWVPLLLLAIGVVGGMTAAMRAGGRVQRGASKDELLGEKLLGTAWVTGFLALLVGITGLTNTLGMPELQTVLWPTASVFLVGLINIGEGAVRRNVTHYVLGSWLALIASAALLLPSPGPFWVLTIAGGGAYLLAAILEPRRIAKLD